jgi:hypothetical protein
MSVPPLSASNVTSFWIDVNGTPTGPHTVTTLTATAKNMGMVPGSHTFRTKGCNENGDCSTFESSVAVKLTVTATLFTTPTAVTSSYGSSICWTVPQLQFDNDNNGNNTEIVRLISSANAA